MIFPTVQFAAFFVVVLVLSWALMPRQRLWKPFILVASYVFYGYADWRFTFLLAASTVANQLAARRDRGLRRRAPAQAAARPDRGLQPGPARGVQVLRLLRRLREPRCSTGIGLQAPLPLLADRPARRHLVLHVPGHQLRRRRLPPGDPSRPRCSTSPIYLSFFPHLVAGPIVRAARVPPAAARSPRNPRTIAARPAVFLDRWRPVQEGRHRRPAWPRTHRRPGVRQPRRPLRASRSCAAIYGYAVQIYCDFSGYTDIAIGLALLLGFRFPQNFDRPYTARSLQDFWRRWHMTLSRWLRDYLYIPLGGNRGGALRRRTGT